MEKNRVSYKENLVIKSGLQKRKLIYFRLTPYDEPVKTLK